MHRGRREAAEQRAEPGLELVDDLPERPGTVPKLQGGASHETATGGRTALDVGEERLAHRGQLAQPRGRGQRGLDHLLGKDPGRFLHGGQLKLLLGAELRG